MITCWVRAGFCGQETTITAAKTSQTKVKISLTTTCELIRALAKEINEIDFGSEIVRPAIESEIYILAAKHVCRNSCIVPAAILKAMEVAGGSTLPASSAIEFIDVVNS